MAIETLGIGSRVKHAAFGDGVIFAVDVAAYRVSFIKIWRKISWT